MRSRRAISNSSMELHGQVGVRCPPCHTTTLLVRHTQPTRSFFIAQHTRNPFHSDRASTLGLSLSSLVPSFLSLDVSCPWVAFLFCRAMSDTRITRNLSVVYRGPGKVSVEDTGYPRMVDPKGQPMPHAVIIQLIATNICGSDLHVSSPRHPLCVNSAVPPTHLSQPCLSSFPVCRCTVVVRPSLWARCLATSRLVGWWRPDPRFIA